jgi:anti-anti-sigma factor
MAGVRTLVTDPDLGFELTVVALDPLRAAICAVGELDLAARDALGEVLQQQEDAGRRVVRVDLSKVAFIDCSCLGILVASHYRFLELHGLLVLTGVDPRTERVLKMAGLGDILFIVPADQNPFGSVLIARAAAVRSRLANQRRAAGDLVGVPRARGRAVS